MDDTSTRKSIFHVNRRVLLFSIKHGEGFCRGPFISPRKEDIAKVLMVPAPPKLILCVDKHWAYFDEMKC